MLEAVSFAARAHRHQLRKDRETPYAAHPYRVCLIVRQVFEIDDLDCLLASILHDTIEDTTTDFDDIAERFGEPVAQMVAALTKDMRLPEKEREANYEAVLAAAGPAVKIAKMADIYDNLADSAHLSAQSRQRAIGNASRYLAAIEQNLPEIGRRPLQIVRDMLDEIARREV